MSPSGSRMQISGTVPASMPFCRRASLSRASGVKTEGARWFLRRRMGGVCLVGRICHPFGAHGHRALHSSDRTVQACRVMFGAYAASFMATATTRTRGEGESADSGDRPGSAEQVGHDSGRERADRVAQVAPEAVDAERARPPGRMGGVGDGGDERRIDHGGAEPEQHAGDEPPAEAARGRRQEQARPPAPTCRPRSGPCGPSGRSTGRSPSAARPRPRDRPP